MYKYKIELTPVEAFFFGGEKHVRTRNGLEMNYFAKSELYPQQTTLLGVLRYYLLMKNGLLNPNKNQKTTEAKVYIGEASFDFESEIEQDFGKIKNISHLYFKKNEQKYVFAPLTLNFALKKEYGNFILDGYNSKVGIQHKLMNINDNTTIKLFKDTDTENDTDFVFIEHNTVGNQKGKKGKTEDDGFYKLNMYKLQKDWCFAFDAEIDIELENDTTFVNVGAEKQVFLFKLTKLSDKNLIAPKLKPTLLPGIFCLSDCFITEEIWKHTIFAVNEKVSFRNLKSSVYSQNYSSFSEGYRRGNRYNLIKRGSVFFFEDEGKREEAEKLFINANAQKIGFNSILKF